jgi:methylated-DNA-[protein]-cysteine S-methyltransferase
MANALEYADVPTPIGTFRIVYREDTVMVVDLLERGTEQVGAPPEARHRKSLGPAGSPPRQLSEYFRRQRQRFELKSDLANASEFDRRVYDELVKVTAGHTITYGELARKTGHAGAARAVGGAMHRNPIPIIIPCHRVVGDDGGLKGFGLGLWRKRWLLDREGAWPLRSRSAEGPRDRAQTTLDRVAALAG